MHIAIDIREACRPAKTGKGQWTYGFVNELLSLNEEITLLTDSDVPNEWTERAANVKKFSPGIRWHFQVKKFLIRSKGLIDVYISPTSYICPFLVGASFPCVPVVHDLIAFRNEPHNRKARWIEKALLPSVVQTSLCIATVSESTQADLLKRYPRLKKKKTFVVYAGPMRGNPEKYMPDGKTILCIGTLCPRKNQLRLIQAYGQLPDDLRATFSLVLAGMRGWQDDAIVDAVKNTNGVTWHDFVPIEEYERLLHSCTVFAFPSLYEGFGMQVLDALQRGVPLLLSNRGSLPEVAGDAAEYVDPEDVDDIRNGLQKLLENTVLRNNLSTLGPQQANQFFWKRTVDLFLSGIRQQLKGE